MTSKTKQIIMAAIGAYLVYTGISLVQDTIVGEPKNQILFILVGVFFALFGLATIIWNIRTIVKETKAEIQGTTAGAEENEDDEEAAKREFKVHDMYTLEHIVLINHIRKGDVLKVAESIAMSALTAVMARESAYTGKVCTWDQMITSDLNVLPKNMALVNVDSKQFEVPLAGVPFAID